MRNEREPKYNIGDEVFVTSYGFTGVVTDIRQFNGVYVYEINGSDSLFTENSLVFADYNDGELLDIHYKYDFGDLVIVDGYDSDIFKVVGFRTEIWRYPDDAWEVVVYELSRITDGEWLEADETELTLAAKQEDADSFIKKHILPSLRKQKKKPRSSSQSSTKQREIEYSGVPNKHKEQNDIDFLLDMYNDYRILFDYFEDEKYEEKMNRVLVALKNLVSE